MALILSGDTGVPASGMPTGSVIQTVYATTTTRTSNTTNTLTDATGFTATITPTSSTSKIMVVVGAQWELFRSAIEVAGWFVILRNGTTVFSQSANSNGMEAGLSSNGRIYMDSFFAPSVIDSPASTSPLTYKLQFALSNTGSSGVMSINNQGNNTQTGSIILLEIKA